MKTVKAYFVISELEGSKYGPSKFGPARTREEAEESAKPFIGRPGWKVEIVEEVVPVSDFNDAPF